MCAHTTVNHCFIVSLEPFLEWVCADCCPLICILHPADVNEYMQRCQTWFWITRKKISKKDPYPVTIVHSSVWNRPIHKNVGQLPIALVPRPSLEPWKGWHVKLVLRKWVNFHHTRPEVARCIKNLQLMCCSARAQWRPGCENNCKSVSQPCFCCAPGTFINCALSYPVSIISAIG